MTVRKTRLWIAAMLAVLAVAAGAVTLGASAAPTDQAPAPASQPATPHGGEANLKLPDLSLVSFLGVPGNTLLSFGLGVCVLGLIFGLVINNQLKNMPVHRVDARDLRADLRDVQDLPDPAGQVPADSRAFHRRDHRRSTSASCSTSRSAASRSSCVLQPRGYRRQLLASHGSASASTPSPTRAPRSRRSGQAVSRATRSR